MKDWEDEGIIDDDERLEGFDLVGYWDASVRFLKIRLFCQTRRRFPFIFKVACDILPCQASAVPCERVFSSSKETDTLRRNHLSPKTMEYLQILKYRIRSERPKPFMENALETEDVVSMLGLSPEEAEGPESHLAELRESIRPRAEV